MNPKKRRNFSGTFQVQERGNGAWQLSRGAPHEMDVFLHGAPHGAAQGFGASVPEGLCIEGLCIEWQDQRALVSFTAGAKAGTVEAAGAIVHEPLQNLYESLPLASIDADARRFWRRVFRLVRFPGGRYLLKLLRRPARA
jgi:hypothetical protein